MKNLCKEQNCRKHFDDDDDDDALSSLKKEFKLFVLFFGYN